MGVTAASLLAALVVLRQLAESPPAGARVHTQRAPEHHTPLASAAPATRLMIHLVCGPDDAVVVQWMVNQLAWDEQRMGRPSGAHMVLPVGNATDTARLLRDLPQANTFLAIEDERIGGCR
jgi:hypothetical protein